jgi:cold shock CspA family protein
MRVPVFLSVPYHELQREGLSLLAEGQDIRFLLIRVTHFKVISV